ncbi:chemotaxis protein CheB [Variovorax sp. J22R133]|uniref:chemotaxis protein CheB n=1 Tax=Variovorax brevis TaxID=3053503 RepID=UPI0025758525|nr:chemotaxis protein CheB [Variovorax sp. J22R133]MDM0113870.1 chemotaxis protein CheB [Variovorax sp. J22R133]
MTSFIERLGHRTTALVVVGASAGGVDALSLLFEDLPACWRLPIVVVLHLPEGHESRLPGVFADRLPLPAREAQDKAFVEAGTLYFAPPGYHLSVERDRSFSLSCEPPVRYSRPSIDVLMASAADAYGPELAGLLLTGANDDGAEGMLRIHAAGGLTAVQDPQHAHVPIMPLAAMALHTPDFVLPLRELRELLLDLDTDHAH